MADDLEARLRRLEDDERSRWSSPWLKLIPLVLLAGLGGVLYYMNKQDKKNVQENGVLLPPVLIHKASAARRDLALLDRDLAELAKEVDKSLSGHPGNKNRKKGDRYINRLHELKGLGKVLEPKLTREEQRVLMATEHAEKLVEQFILSTYGEAFYDHKLIDTAQKQVARAQALARGEAADTIVGGGPSSVGNVVGQIKSIAGGLQEIKKLKDTQPGMSPEVLADIEGPKKVSATKTHKTHKRKHKKKHED